MEQFPVTPVDPPRKKRSKLPFIILGVLLLLAIGAAAFAGSRYFAAQSQLTSLTTDNAKLTKDNSALKEQAATNSPSASSQAPGAKSAADLMKDYQALKAQSIDVDEGDHEAILDAVQKYYKVDQQPVGADVLLVYQDPSADTHTPGEVHALVYWPQTGTKPAGLIDMIRPAGAIEWQYNDML